VINLLYSIALQVGVDTPNRFNNFLILAYVVMGVIGLLYVLSLYVRQRNLQKDIELMRQLLEEDQQT
jgi:predicted membrane channel-forming protein YqfA (hemolysin III family)